MKIARSFIGSSYSYKYSFDTSSLTGEELLILDEILPQLMGYLDEQYDEEVEFDRAYNYFKRASGYEPPKQTVNYEDDKAWMYAMNKVINDQFDMIERGDHNMEISQWESSAKRKFNDEQSQVWNKVCSKAEYKNRYNW